jgi:hypothetical protein
MAALLWISALPAIGPRMSEVTELRPPRTSDGLRFDPFSAIIRGSVGGTLASFQKHIVIGGQDSFYLWHIPRGNLNCFKEEMIYPKFGFLNSVGDLDMRTDRQ